MQVDVIASVNEARSDDFINKTVVVIDVLRATSTIVTALEFGCAGVIPVETVSQALKLQESGMLLGGERFCKKILGFDLGNSPVEYMHRDLTEKRIIITTTNGTRALQKTHKAANILAGSVLNARSCAEAAIQLKRDIVLVCAGTQDDFSLEDGLCAGLIADELCELSGEAIALNDLGTAMQAAYRHVKDCLETVILESANGKKLSKMGLKEDVIYCCRKNRYQTVPFMHEQMMLPFEGSKTGSRSYK